MVLSSTFLVKVNSEGMLTIEMPQMAEKYLVIEQTDEHLTITPLDLERDQKAPIIARRGRQWTMLGASPTREIPLM